jgi:hypothetical protein
MSRRLYNFGLAYKVLDFVSINQKIQNSNLFFLKNFGWKQILEIKYFWSENFFVDTQMICVSKNFGQKNFRFRRFFKSLVLTTKAGGNFSD